MSEPEKPWSALSISVKPERGNENVYDVEFLWGGQAERGPNGPAAPVPFVLVKVDTQGGCKVIDYRAPDGIPPSFERRDFEVKAVEEVKKRLTEKEGKR